MDKESRKSVIGWEPITSHIIRVRLYSKCVKITVIQCYVPTEPANKEEKDNFYKRLQLEIDKTQRHDVLIMM